MLSTVVLLTGIATMIISLKYFPSPFIWIFLSWFLVFLFVALSRAKSSLKLLFFYISLIPLTFGIYETYLSIEDSEVRHIYTEGVTTNNHEFLGYAPLRNSTASHEKYYKNELIFKAVYSIDANGLRIPPPFNSKGMLGSVLLTT